MLSTLEILLPLIGVFAVVFPLLFILKHGVNQKNAKQRVLTQVCVFVAVFAFTFLFGVNKVFAEETAVNSINGTLAQGLGFIAAAIVTSCSCLGAGMAVTSAAPAAIGAISENPENFGKAMIFVVLGEGVAIYGLLISILIINKL